MECLYPKISLEEEKRQHLCMAEYYMKQAEKLLDGFRGEIPSTAKSYIRLSLATLSRRGFPKKYDKKVRR